MMAKPSIALVTTAMLAFSGGTAATAPGLQFMNPAGLSDSSKHYSHVAIAPAGGTTIYIAGQGGFDKTKHMIGDKRAQMHQAFLNIKTALEAAGATGADVVSINVYIVAETEADLAPLAEEEKALFKPGSLPTSTLVPVTRLAVDSGLFEINATAVVYPK